MAKKQIKPLLAINTPQVIYLINVQLGALRRFVGLGWIAVGAFLLLFLALTFLIEAMLRPLLSGSAAYAPALLALVVTGSVLAARSHRVGRYLLAAAAVFFVSLTLRTLDEPLCSVLPSGTHFLWHLINAATLAILLVAAARHARPLPLRG